MNDLRLLISISNYSALNFGVAEAAKKAFQRHLWYLTEELAPLAFFTHDVDESTKEELRVTLLNQKYLLPSEISKRHGSGFGKPTFPDMNDLPQQNLSELFGRESWHFSLSWVLLIQKFYFHPFQVGLLWNRFVRQKMWFKLYMW